METALKQHFLSPCLIQQRANIWKGIVGVLEKSV